MRLSLAVAAVLVWVSLGLVGMARVDPPAVAVGGQDGAVRAAMPAVKTVRLTIDYGDGVQKVFTSLEHRAGMTVLDLLGAGSKHPRGITFAHKGSGETAFVKQIDDLANQGGGDGKRNWLFLVNGRKGTRGSGVTTLAPGDEVVWEFSSRHAED